jgi:hypothetical protein
MPSSPTPPFPWRPGEHVAAIGDTGTGKTYLLARGLLNLRNYVVVLKTKPDKDDATKWAGFLRIRKAKGMQNERYSRFLLEPEYREQAVEGWRMSEAVWRQGSWTVVYDEEWLAEKIGLTDQIERLLTQSRSKNVSVVSGMQRPVGNSRFVISQSTHVFCFRVEGRDAKTVAEATSPRILPVLESLHGHEFAYYNRATRYVGKATTATLGSLIVAPGNLSKRSEGSIDTAPVTA